MQKLLNIDIHVIAIVLWRIDWHPYITLTTLIMFYGQRRWNRVGWRARAPSLSSKREPGQWPLYFFISHIVANIVADNFILRY